MGKEHPRKWKYFLDEDFCVLIRSDGTTHEYYDVFSKDWQEDPFGAGTFSGHSNDSIRFHEVPEEKVPDIIGKRK